MYVRMQQQKHLRRLTEAHHHSSNKAAAAKQSPSLSLARQQHCTVYNSQQPNSLESYSTPIYTEIERMKMYKYYKKY